MARFEEGTFAEVIETGRIGVVVERKRNKVYLVFRDNPLDDDEPCEFKEQELQEAKLSRLKMSQLKPLVRGEISITEISNGANFVEPCIENDSPEYKITAEDLLAGVNHYEGKRSEDVYLWISSLLTHAEDISLPGEERFPIRDSIIEYDILAYASIDLEFLSWEILDNKPEVVTTEDFKDTREVLETWVNSGGAQCPKAICVEVIEQYDYNNIDKQSEATQQLFKECLDYLCDERRDPKAIQRRGYCYYCGTKIYPNDWVKARDAFIDYYQMTGDASAANTLGYIYYYGRCNGGEPEYEEAFKYFSIGHAYGYFESTYKLADMFAHGYAVVENGETANHLYWDVYRQNLKHFTDGNPECKFADAALRMGNCFRDGIGAEKDLRTSYYYYLQADFAIRERVRIANHYGDTVVFNSVQKALADVRNMSPKPLRKIRFNYPKWADWSLIDHRRCKLSIKELKDGALSIDASPLKRRDEYKAPKMLITIPEADYCGLKEKIHLKTAKNSKIKTISNLPEIIFDNWDFDWDKMKASFYLGDDLVGEIITKCYDFTAPMKKAVTKTGKLYHFATIVFGKSNRGYDYLCDDESVEAGNFVIVNGYDGETTVKVVAVTDKHESELVLPIDRYKKIIRKA